MMVTTIKKGTSREKIRTWKNIADPYPCSKTR